jgi:hypothetical protein
MGAYKWYQVYTSAIPIIAPTADNKKLLLPLLHEILLNGKETVQDEINNTIFNIIGLTENERDYINTFISKRAREISNNK